MSSMDWHVITMQLIGDSHYKSGHIEKACIAWEQAAEYAEKSGKTKLAVELRERIAHFEGDR